MDFLDWFHGIAYKYGLNIEIYYSSIVDWNIKIGYKSTSVHHGEIILDIQHCDVNYVFAKAQVLLKEWLMENKGGY
jgi:hypothetical protein